MMHSSQKISKLTSIFLLVFSLYGQINSIEAATQHFTLDVTSRFKPWISLRLSDKSGGNTPSNPWEIIPNQSQCLYAYTTTEDTNKNLPTRYDALVKAHAENNVELSEQNLKEETVIHFGSVSGTTSADSSVFGSPPKLCTKIRPLSGQVNLSTAFSSKVRYLVEGKLVTLPGGNLGYNIGNQCLFPGACACQPGDPTCAVDPCVAIPGSCDPCANNACPPQCNNNMSLHECLCRINPDSCTETDFLAAGADIEGGYLAASDKFLHTQSLTNGTVQSQATHLGESTVVDVREEITRNAYTLIRAKTPMTSIPTDLSNLENGKITYIKGGWIKIGSPDFLTEMGVAGSTPGNHTIIIEDGNLLIAGDLKYGENSKNDSIGIILINSNYTLEPGTTSAGSVAYAKNGNIFVNTNVQEFAGLYFADGSLITTKKTDLSDPPSILGEFDQIDRLNTNGDLDHQLILTGGLLTRNTLGGSEIIHPIDPWGKNVRAENARIFDLHYIRRYFPSLPPILTNCTQLDPGICYGNRHSFVIRVDSKNSQNPPPGFIKSDQIIR